MVNRDWEYDEKIPEDQRDKCKDVARQLVEDNPNINVSYWKEKYHNACHIKPNGDFLGEEKIMVYEIMVYEAILQYWLYIWT